MKTVAIYIKPIEILQLMEIDFRSAEISAEATEDCVVIRLTESGPHFDMVVFRDEIKGNVSWGDLDGGDV